MAAGKGMTFFAVRCRWFDGRVFLIRPGRVVKMTEGGNRAKGDAADQKRFPYHRMVLKKEYKNQEAKCDIKQSGSDFICDEKRFCRHAVHPLNMIFLIIT